MVDLEGSMQIGVVAERTAISIPTLRHWEDAGLVIPSARSAGGFRLYTEDDVQRILAIRRMKPLEFSLAEMREALEALDTLTDATASADEAQSAQAVLSAARHRVQQATARLKKRLAYAAELDGILEQKAQDPSRPV